jgi:hypothetical protein
MQTNPQRINKIHKEVYGFEQPREFNDKDRRRMLRFFSNGKHNGKKLKNLRSHRKDFFTPEEDHSFSLEDQLEEFLFHNYQEEMQDRSTRLWENN